ncbi:hypothetical protein BIW11_02290 [Tropilaelaps mercedesae]|uniref:Uncharacterized protein n=1 Tax=Tropilaelaps mercedesae TaxID=418985 RepID=A0A1V9X0H5_9ACAR|nr:hypothetical protein BIW11_02290 [Tropilaelaps mercedesae]
MPEAALPRTVLFAPPTRFLRSADAFISSPTENENCLFDQHRENRDQRDPRDREEIVNITDNLLSEVAPRGVMDQDGTGSNLHGTAAGAGAVAGCGFKENRNSMGVTFKVDVAGMIEPREKFSPFVGSKTVVLMTPVLSSEQGTGRRGRRTPTLVRDDALGLPAGAAILRNPSV